MREQWTAIFDDRDEHFATLDHNTVSLIETLAPRHDIGDATRIKELLRKGRIFPTLNEIDRNAVLVQLLVIDGRILFFKTFLQDTRYLEACTKSLRCLLSASSRSRSNNAPPESLCQKFSRHYTRINQGPARIRVQTRNFGIKAYLETAEACRSLTYAQLILAVMRDFPHLSHVVPRSDAKKANSIVEGHSEEYRYNLINLAFELGYETSEIRNLRFTNQFQSLARAFLKHSRPSDIYEIDTREFDRLTNRIAESLPLMARPRLFDTLPPFTAESDTVEKSARWNRPRNEQFQRDKEYLYLDVMYNYDPLPGRYLTSLAFQRDIFVSFFGARFLYSAADGQKGEGSPSAPPVPISEQDEESNQNSNQHSDHNSPNAQLENPVRSHELPDDMSSLDIVREIVSTESLTIYDWKRHQIVRFADATDQRASVEHVASALADQGYCFLIREDGDSISICRVRGVWEVLQNVKKILVGPKDDIEDIIDGRVVQILRLLDAHHQRQEPPRDGER